MLESGRIRKVDKTHYDREAEAAFTTINVTDALFQTEHIGDAAWIIGHELGHIIQWEQGMLMSEIGNANVRPDRRRMDDVARLDEKDPKFKAMQDDANRYGCANATGMVVRQGHCP